MHPLFTKLFRLFVALPVVKPCVVCDRQITHWDLYIKDAQPEHAGTYKCQVVATKIYAHYVTLVVLGTNITLTFNVE